jgi:hypothetical protein
MEVFEPNPMKFNSPPKFNINTIKRKPGQDFRQSRTQRLFFNEPQPQYEKPVYLTEIQKQGNTKRNEYSVVYPGSNNTPKPLFLNKQNLFNNNISSSSYQRTPGEMQAKKQTGKTGVIGKDKFGTIRVTGNNIRKREPLFRMMDVEELDFDGTEKDHEWRQNYFLNL